MKHAVLFPIFRYRPLGYPMTHIAKVLKFNHSIATVHLVGPVNLIDGSPAPHDIGICMVAGFEGVVSRGRRPDVGGDCEVSAGALHDVGGALGSCGAFGGE